MLQYQTSKQDRVGIYSCVCLIEGFVSGNSLKLWVL